jgi:hypothetical protein
MTPFSPSELREFPNQKDLMAFAPRRVLLAKVHNIDADG